jgi:Flp pilus assembly pilin Flp
VLGLEHTRHPSRIVSNKECIVIVKTLCGSFKTRLGQFLRDESGAEVVEIVLVVGLIAVICLVAMGAFGKMVGIRWNDVTDAL